MVLVQAVNYYNCQNLSERAITHSGSSLIIYKKKIYSKKTSSILFLLQASEDKTLHKFEKDTDILEILLNFTFLYSKQSEISIPLTVTNDLRQISQLLFMYYVHGKANYSVDQVVSLLVERILVLNSDLLSNEDPFILLLKYMEKNVEKQLYVKDFCSILHVSESSLNRLCIKKCGMTAMKLFRKIKCKEAEQLLLSSSLSIKEISSKLGFKNSKNFSTMYFKNEGISPIEKRKMIRNVNK